MKVKISQIFSANNLVFIICIDRTLVCSVIRLCNMIRIYRFERVITSKKLFYYRFTVHR